MKRAFVSFQSDRVLREVPDLRKDFCDFKENRTKGHADGFADAVTVWINKPHVVNRRLCGSRIESIVYYTTENDDTQLQTSFEKVVAAALNNELSDKTFADTEQDGFCKEVPSLSTIPEGQGVVVIRDIHPKRHDTHPVVREVICYDGTIKSAWFCPVTDTYKHKAVEASRNLCYQLVHCVLDNKPRILCRICKMEKDSWCSETESTKNEPGSDEPDPLTTNTEPVLKQMEQADIGYKLTTKSNDPDTSIILSDYWLKHILLPKIANWSEQGKLETTVKSLRLVRIDQYNTLYNQLKVKYGKKFVECWPEKTDPAKFVYEDVGIATYLLLIWEQERKEKNLTEKQSFVDLGCGNGLLVHILSAEGHPGVGLDVRKRNIWDLYGPETHLKEQTVIPSCDSLFPQYDWLIGNHSDELTPWIPVMAARSSYTCRYFVLPCCPFDFDRKFNKKVSGQSSYRCFLDWVAEVGQICGFQVEEDTLRIPSVKRVCFIGKTRSYSENEEYLIDAKRTIYIKSRCDKRGLKGDNQDFTSSDKKSAMNDKYSNSDQNVDCPTDSKRQRLGGGNPDEQQWTSTFKPRESKEQTRNCQHVKKKIKELIVNKVFTRIMESEDAEFRQTSDGRLWHKGGSVPLSEVAQMFDREVLKELKSECGGLQTLLRNHNMVFNVSGGKVQLRDLTLSQPFSKASQLGQTKKIKTLLCWFHLHHPDGCPQSTDTCLFAHGEEDLHTCEKNTLSDSQNK